jgi:hypothetical protein
MTSEQAIKVGERLVIMGLSRDEYLHKLTDIYVLCVMRPFPNGPIMTEVVSKAIPTLPQSNVFATVQHLKLLIAEQEFGPAPTHTNN